MKNEKLYKTNEVCEILNISNWTFINWYRWERKQVANNECEPYLPVPDRIMNEKGRPRVWTTEMVEQLKKFKAGIVTGRNGKYGKYSNPNHFNTRKYKKSELNVDN